MNNNTPFVYGSECTRGEIFNNISNLNSSVLFALTGAIYNCVYT